MDISTEKMADMYTNMTKIRMFETRVSELRRRQGSGIRAPLRR